MSAGFNSDEDGGPLGWARGENTPPCMELADAPAMLECVYRGGRRAMPYGDLLSCVSASDPVVPEQQRIVVRYPGVMITVSGRGLEAVWNGLIQQRLKRVAVIDPARVFEARGVVVEEIVVVDAV